MARKESDREDLLREATALVERIELAPAHAEGDHVVAGFRADGAISFYFGADPVYQFNSHGQLRRAFCDGHLLKAERGRLVSLRRVRDGNEVQLRRHELTNDEQVEFLSSASQRLRELAKRCENQVLVIVGQVPQDADVFGRVMTWLANRRDLEIAQSPHAR